MTTLADVIARCRGDQLHEYPTLNQLDGPITDSATTIAMLRELNTIAPAQRLSVDLEDLIVWETSGQTVGVLRGANGTTQATHADQALVLVGARFSNAQIARAVNDELASLSAEGLWRPATVELTTSGSEQSYDLDAPDLLDLYEVRVDDTDPANTWPLVPASLDWDADTSEFASGVALRLRDWPDPGRPLRVTYKRSFGSLSDLTDDVEDAGLWPEAHDIMAIGAAARLMAGTEVTRSRMSSQGDIRRAGEVPPGTNLQASRGLLALREARIAQEVRRLRNSHPIPMGTR